MKVSYNQVIKQLNDFATNHKQVKSFGNGDLWEVVQHDQLTNFNYPLLWVVDQAASMGDGDFTWNFQVIVMDIVRKDESNENEVKSDCVQILIDLVAYFEQLNNELNNVNWNQVQLVRSGSVELFTERFEDELSGASVQLGLRFPQNYNYCEVPI
jgi:hypothetical protein